MPHRYPAGVTSLPEPLAEAFERFSARTAFLPRTNPVADNRAVSPLTDRRNPTPAPPRPLTGITATSVTLQPFSDIDQNGLAVLTRERQGGDACSTLPKSDISSGCTTGQYSLMNFKISQEQLAIAFLRSDQSRMFAGDPLQGICS